jgi:hypothetical protein
MTLPAGEQLELEVGEYDQVAGRISALEAAGSGWVNLRPIIAEEHLPDPPGFFAIFGNSAHRVPTGTWLAGKRLPDGTAKRSTVGLQHSTGPRLARRLTELGLPLPEGWVITQDHPRRGLVAKLPDGASSLDTVEWLVRAGTVVCAVPVTGRWSADVHAGRG